MWWERFDIRCRQQLLTVDVTWNPWRYRSRGCRDNNCKSYMSLLDPTFGFSKQALMLFSIWKISDLELHMLHMNHLTMNDPSSVGPANIQRSRQIQKHNPIQHARPARKQGVWPARPKGCMAGCTVCRNLAQGIMNHALFRFDLKIIRNGICILRYFRNPNGTAASFFRFSTVPKT